MTINLKSFLKKILHKFNFTRALNVSRRHSKNSNNIKIKRNSSSPKCSTSILIKDFCYAYGEENLFHHLNHHFASGKFHSILGPSGIGKSTLLRCIAGLESFPQKGSIQLIGASEKNPIGWLAQEDALLPWLNILENILLQGNLTGKKTFADKKKAFDYLELFNLTSVAYHKPHQLSVGMRQRVALARTFLQNASLLLMDEPFSAVDTLLRLELQTITVQHTSHLTVLMVTHDPLEALRMSHEIHILAGKPASFIKTISLDGAPPRDAGDPEVFINYQKILHLLQEIQ